ncbi:tetratricopeptide repeat protein [Nonomuraea sp. NPDC050556]|uniref:tetratricopeptide repeat protein n=1 Tax=Nonomuraea sp. NPDC050556 TaxID=3364369 RepID=UPI003787A8E8
MRALLISGGVVAAAAAIFTAVAISAPPATTPTDHPTQPQAETLQTRLKRLPRDHRSWAQLTLQYVDQARTTGDPTYYTKAEQALKTATHLAPEDDAVLTGTAALAAARHDFTNAVKTAKKAINANPYGPTAYGVLADAQTQLGDLPAATRTIDRLMSLRPGVPAFTRASYAAELRGDLPEARKLLTYALNDAFTPSDLAYCRYYLGELSLRSGDLTQATTWYAKALEASPAFTPAIAGQARVLALSGQISESVSRYQTVVERLPLPQYLVEYGEVRIKAGLTPDWTLLRAEQQLLKAAGVQDDLTWAEFEADHGTAAAAVRHARAEYAKHPNAVAADALAWALHRSGRDAEALPYARKATSTGWRNALLYHHRAEIERALGVRGTAASLVSRYNPRFDPTLPALARFS